MHLLEPRQSGRCDRLERCEDVFGSHHTIVNRPGFRGFGRRELINLPARPFPVDQSENRASDDRVEAFDLLDVESAGQDPGVADLGVGVGAPPSTTGAVSRQSRPTRDIPRTARDRHEEPSPGVDEPVGAPYFCR